MCAQSQQPFQTHQPPSLADSLQDLWRWVDFDSTDGLPGAEISQIVESDDGTIWANTSGGVAWYDGFQWRAVPCPEAQSAQSRHQIQSFGKMAVIASGASNLTIFQRNSCRSVSLTYNSAPVRISSTGALTAGKILLVDQDRNVFSWDGTGPSISKQLLHADENLGTRRIYIYGDSLFSATNAGMIQIDSSGSRVALDGNTLKNPDHLGGLYVRAAAINNAGSGILSIAFPQEWIGVWEWNGTSPLSRVKQSTEQVARLLALSRTGDAIAVYNTGEAWMKSGGRWSRFNPIPGPLRGANSISFDSKGRLWVATAHGIHMLRSDQDYWSRRQFQFPAMQNHVNALLVARDGKLWTGTADGIMIISPNGDTQSIKSIEGRPLGLLTSMVQDQQGRIWISSGATIKGVYRFDGQSWKRFGAESGLMEVPHHKVVADTLGNVWALATGRGSRDGKSGVFRFNGTGFDRWDTANGLIDSRVYDVTADKNGALWFASVSAISRYANKAWKNWLTSRELKQASPFRLRPRPDGGVYFLDRTNGLGEVFADGSVGYQKIAATAAGQGSWDTLTDPLGQLWVSSRGGLHLFRNQNWSTIGPSAGLENPELWPLALWNNQVCTGTDGSGLYCLSLDFLNRPKPRIAVEPPRVDGTTASLAWRVIGFGESADMEGNLARYRLDGGNWSPWQSAGLATLTGLNRGDHRFELQARDHFGAQSEILPAIQFEVQAPLYQQPVFLIPVSLSILAALAALYAFVSRTFQHNRQLAEKEESFRALIEYSSVGITLWDRNRRVFYVSPAVSIILGYDSHELLGEFRADIIHPDDLAETQSRLSTLIENSGQTQRSRLRMLHKNGQYRWIEMISRNLFDNPSVGAIVTNLRDITDSTNAEIAAAEARQRAENANHAKSDFLAMISHEIRTPMNGITGMCQLLLESNLNKDQLDYAETIGQSAQSLLALINDVLDFSRIEAGKLTIERAPIDLSNLLNEVFQLMRVRAEEKGLKLEVVYPPDAPRAFYGDALRIRQILFNLTGNAVKFTHNGSVRLEAAIRYISGSRYAISIAVRDTGIGISAEKLPLVFQKFTQADLSTTRRYGGSGLGLSISQSLAELMGGSIEATSAVSEGSEFRLEIELDAAPENSLTRRDSTVDALQPLPESLDILLVEDNKVNQKLALRLLQRLGCEATIAASGIEALELLDKHNYDLILMDCQMPEMDGYETTRRIREREHSQRHIPIVAITANAMESDLERCITSGMDSYLTKPIDFIKLRDALETWGIDYRAPRATSDPGAS